MHSIKNTVVAVILLGVTYTVYQSITTPEPMDNAIAALNVTVDDSLDSMYSQPAKFVDNATQSIQGMAGKFGQKVQGMTQQAGDAAKQMVLSLIHI